MIPQVKLVEQGSEGHMWRARFSSLNKIITSSTAATKVRTTHLMSKERSELIPVKK